MGIILDLITVAIVIISVFFASRRGFVRTVINFVGLFAAFIIAFTVSTPLANMTYTHAIEPSILNTVEAVIDNGTENTADAVWTALPKFIKNNSDPVMKYELAQQIEDNISVGATRTSRKISESFVMPMVTKLLATFYGVVIFIVLLFIVRVLSRVLNKLFSFSLIGKLNSALGGVVGLLQGSLIALIFMLVVGMLISLTGGFWSLTPEALENSYIYGFISNF